MSASSVTDGAVGYPGRQTGLGWLVPRRQPHLPGQFPDLGLGEAGLDHGTADAVLLRCLQTRPEVAQVVDVGAVDYVGVALFRGQERQAGIELVLAEVTAAGVVRPVVGPLDLAGLDDAVVQPQARGDLNGAGKLGRCEARRACRNGQGLLVPVRRWRLAARSALSTPPEYATTTDSISARTALSTSSFRCTLDPDRAAIVIRTILPRVVPTPPSYPSTQIPHLRHSRAERPLRNPPPLTGEGWGEGETPVSASWVLCSGFRRNHGVTQRSPQAGIHPRQGAPSLAVGAVATHSASIIPIISITQITVQTLDTFVPISYTHHTTPLFRGANH